jgi:hypothetical protein
MKIKNKAHSLFLAGRMMAVRPFCKTLVAAVAFMFLILEACNSPKETHVNSMSSGNCNSHLSDYYCVIDKYAKGEQLKTLNIECNMSVAKAIVDSVVCYRNEHIGHHIKYDLAEYYFQVLPSVYWSKDSVYFVNAVHKSGFVFINDSIQNWLDQRLIIADGGGSHFEIAYKVGSREIVFSRFPS